jgi:hypothetical protein
MISIVWLKSRSVQGGGTVIHIRNKIIKYISLEKNQIQFIWFSEMVVKSKITKNGTRINSQLKLLHDKFVYLDNFANNFELPILYIFQRIVILWNRYLHVMLVMNFAHDNEYKNNIESNLALTWLFYGIWLKPYNERRGCTYLIAGTPQNKK